ncbi:MAG TPA: OmpA family protein, partial [bacterium]|nr:OmpA family protein [bacterium]
LIAQRRAASVVDYMRSHGVRPDVGFQSVSYGSWRPAASNDTEEGRALNRRVVFVIGEREFERGGAVPAPKPVPGMTAPAATSPSPAPAAYVPPAPTPAATPAASPAEGEAPAEGTEDLPAKAKRPPSRWQ